MMLTEHPVGRPTDPAFRVRGGSGLEAIWCAASVIPYASSRGTSNRLSILCMISGESGVLAERIKRSVPVNSGRSELPARASRSWWIVGTAEYHVTRYCRTNRQNESGLNLVGTTIAPPLSKVASVDATSPCTWNSGMTQSATSSVVSEYVAATFRADVARLQCLSGTRFGRPVLPLVCRISATSSGDGAVNECPLVGASTR